MLTKLSFRISLFAAILTFAYCFLNDISTGEVVHRAIIVFSGFYVILISFFILLRIIIRPGRSRMTNKFEQKRNNKAQEQTLSESEVPQENAIGVGSE